MNRDFQILNHPDKGLLAIKSGFSWPGFFLGWIWAAAKGLYVHAAVLFVIVAALGALVFYVPDVVLVWTVLGWATSYIVGQKGNIWLARKMEKRGYAYRGMMVGDSPKHAVALYKRSEGETVTSSKARSAGLFGLLPTALHPVISIVVLTWKAAFRYRLFLVASALLVGAVVLLPMLIKDDGTARGFTQILLTYTLSSITVLLGFATLWLSCGVLAGDIESCQLQMVAVKPIPRWQIWIGKWLGVVTLNAALLTIAGGSVYGMLIYRAGQLPEDQQKILRREFFVARGSLTEPMPDVQSEIDAVLAASVSKINTNNMDFQFVRQQIEEEVRGGYQIVPPNTYRVWTIPVGLASRVIGNEPIILRFRFYGTDTNSLAAQLCELQVGNPEGAHINSARTRMAANTFHEVPMGFKSVGANATIDDILDKDGNLIVWFSNRDDSAVIFPLEDGLEVLYREGSFGLNYIRGLVIILFWLSLLAALGLAAASYMSFPVACFFTLAMLLVALSSGTMSMTIAEGTIMGVNRQTGEPISRAFDLVLMPLFRVLLWLVTLVQGFSPVDSLSSGRSITWGTLLRAFGQIVFLLGGLIALVGVVLLNRRELATAQSNQ